MVPSSCTTVPSFESTTPLSPPGRTARHGDANKDKAASTAAAVDSQHRDHRAGAMLSVYPQGLLSLRGLYGGSGLVSTLLSITKALGSVLVSVLRCTLSLEGSGGYLSVPFEMRTPASYFFFSLFLSSLFSEDISALGKPAHGRSHNSLRYPRNTHRHESQRWPRRISSSSYRGLCVRGGLARAVERQTAAQREREKAELLEPNVWRRERRT